MPIPSRKKDEDREQFMSRCMSDENMKKDYKQNQQRIAVCLTKASEGMSSMAAADLHYTVEEFGYTEELSEEKVVIRDLSLRKQKSVKISELISSKEFATWKLIIFFLYLH